MDVHGLPQIEVVREVSAMHLDLHLPDRRKNVSSIAPHAMLAALDVYFQHVDETLGVGQLSSEGQQGPARKKGHRIKLLH